jgi:hypothetical protein
MTLAGGKHADPLRELKLLELEVRRAHVHKIVVRLLAILVRENNMTALPRLSPSPMGHGTITPLQIYPRSGLHKCAWRWCARLPRCHRRRESRELQTRRKNRDDGRNR